MVSFIKGVFEAGLKTNNNLEKGILTGCLRVSKESIFTGLNNFNVYSIVEKQSSQCFGFNQEETTTLLKAYNLGNYVEKVKEWYDGYRFGTHEIYNPWSVLKYINRGIQETPVTEPYWVNTSSNSIILEYIKKADVQLRNEFVALIKGQAITKPLVLELTYNEMDNIRHVYSFLLTTGYLKIIAKQKNNYTLAIPNKEIRTVYENLFMDYFHEYTENKKDGFIEALKQGNSQKAMSVLNNTLQKSISYYDNFESFYHGFLLGLFSEKNIESNRESGNGRADLIVFGDDYLDTTLVLECKHSDNDDKTVADSKKATKQIKEKNYIEGIKIKGYENVIGYGIAFYQKRCYITQAK